MQCLCQALAWYSVTLNCVEWNKFWIPDLTVEESVGGCLQPSKCAIVLTQVLSIMTTPTPVVTGMALTKDPPLQ
jgi:hypothetical protein